MQVFGGAALPSSLTAATSEAIKELLHEGESPNTRASYQSAMRYWGAWVLMRFGQEMQLPLNVPVVLQFIVDHVERNTDAGLVSEMPPDMAQALVDAGYHWRAITPAERKSPQAQKALECRRTAWRQLKQSGAVTPAHVFLAAVHRVAPALYLRMKH